MSELTEMELVQAQIKLEEQYSSKNTIPYVRRLIGDDANINACIEAFEAALLEWEEPEVGDEPMKQVVDFLLDADITDLIYSIHAYILSKNGQWCTIQEVIGSQMKRMSDLEEIPLRLLAGSYLVSAACNSKYLQDRVRKGYQTLIRSTITFNSSEEVMGMLKTQGYVLPSIIPLREVTCNFDSGYYTFDKSVILGGKGHNYEVCLSHINRVNSVPFQYEKRLRQITEPVFDESSQLKKDGTWETKTDIEERRETFQQLHTSLPKRIEAIQEHSNVFYLAHGYCTRGRTHVNAHEYNYMGTKFLKGMIDLAELEIIEPEF